MDDRRFDALTKSLVSRRAGLGLALAGVIGLAADAAAKKQSKKCKPKCTICKKCVKGKCKPKPNGTACGPGKSCTGGVCRPSTCPTGQIRCAGICVDPRTDDANCGSCGNTCATGQACQGGTCTCTAASCPNGCCDGATCQPGSTLGQCGTNGAVCRACPGGNACNTAACDQGVCSTTPTPSVSCDGGAGTCDAAGRCQPAICVGKTSANPCFPRDASTCNTSGSACRCGSDLNGVNHCYENAYCNGPTEQCTSNADCEATLGRAGAICFSATSCCGGQTGCATPCPNQ